MKSLFLPEIGELELYRKKGRKNISLQYKYAEQRFRISFPYNCPEKVAIQFVNEKLDWMKETKKNSTEKVIARKCGNIDRFEALKNFIHLANEICNTTGLHYKELKIRKMKTLWGSCSYDNKICLNLYLANLPIKLQYYVILHELCHTVVKNHSKKFWNLVTNFWEEALVLDSELKKYIP